jgi:hypothetical protein
MKNIKIIIFCFLLPYMANTQTETLFGGSLNVFSVSAIAVDTFQIQGLFNDSFNRYSSDNSSIGNIVWDIDCNRFSLVEIISNTGGIINAKVFDLNSSGMFSSGICAIMKETVDGNFPVSQIPGISENLQYCINDHFRNIVGSGGASLPTVNGTEIKYNEKVILNDSLYNLWQVKGDVFKFIVTSNSLVEGNMVLLSNDTLSLATPDETEPLDSVATLVVVNVDVDTVYVSNTGLIQTGHNFVPGSFAYVDALGTLDTAANGISPQLVGSFMPSGYVMVIIGDKGGSAEPAPQTLSLVGDTLTISDGNSVVLPPSIDSTTYSNDSAHVWSGGTDYFTGITDAPRPNNGRIWYVSKSNPNCSVSAVVGDPTQPFCNPWVARDSAISGDVIEVFPGEYDINLDGAAGSTRFMWIDGYWHFHAGARIVNTSATAYTMFPAEKTRNITGQKCIVTGALSTGFAGLNGGIRVLDIWGAAILGTPNTFYLEADNLQNNLRISVTDTISRVFVKIREHTISGGYALQLGANCFFDDVNFSVGRQIISTGGGGIVMANNKKRANVSIDIKEMVVQSENTFALFSIGATTDSASFNVNVGKIKINPSVTFNTANSSKLIDAQNTTFRFRHGYFGLKIGYIDDQSLDSLPLFGARSLQYINSVIDVDIGSAKTVNGSFFKQNVAWNDSSNYYFKVRLFGQYNNRPIITFNGTSPNSNFNFEGDFTGNQIVALFNSGTHRSINFKNCLLKTYSSTKPAIAFNNATNNVQFINSRIIGSVAVAPVSSSVAVNVGVMNSFSNSSVVDSDVTELIQPITRNSNVK